MATTTYTSQLELKGCKVCDSKTLKLMKPCGGIPECTAECDEEYCAEDCSCGQCACDLECELDEDDNDEQCIDSCLCPGCIGRKMYGTVWDSLYASGLGPTSGWRGWTLDYEMCSVKELKRMIQDRGLVDPYPSGTTTKLYYVRTLTKADRAPHTFRFLDLPPEMRNIIYLELLTLPTETCREHRFCFPQILCASQKVHKEAKELLYTENAINFDFEAIFTPSNPTAHIDTSAFIHNKILEHDCCCCGDVIDVMEPLDLYIPSFIRRVHALNINVSFVSGNTRIPAISLAVADDMVRKILLLLASALMDQNCLKSLHIILKNDGESLNWSGAAHFLAPLRRLRNIAEVVVSDKVATTALAIVSDITGDEPTFNTIKQLHLILAETEIYMQLHNSIDPLVDSARYRSSSHLRSTAKQVLNYQKMQIELALNQEFETDMFANEHTELDLQIRLAKMRDCLDKVASDKFSERLKELATARRASLALATSTQASPSVYLQNLSGYRTPPPTFEPEDSDWD